jgi:hypothetical protein
MVGGKDIAMEEREGVMYEVLEGDAVTRLREVKR